MSLSSKIEELQRRWRLPHDGCKEHNHSFDCFCPVYDECADELTPLLEQAREMLLERDALKDALLAHGHTDDVEAIAASTPTGSTTKWRYPTCGEEYTPGVDCDLNRGGPERKLLNAVLKRMAAPSDQKLQREQAQAECHPAACRDEMLWREALAQAVAEARLEELAEYGHGCLYHEPNLKLNYCRTCERIAQLQRWLAEVQRETH